MFQILRVVFRYTSSTFWVRYVFFFLALTRDFLPTINYNMYYGLDRNLWSHTGTVNHWLLFGSSIRRKRGSIRPAPHHSFIERMKRWMRWPCQTDESWLALILILLHCKDMLSQVNPIYILYHSTTNLKIFWSQRALMVNLLHGIRGIQPQDGAHG